MKLYNSLISSLSSHLGRTVPKRFAYDPRHCWEETEEFEMVMMRSSALELGGDGKPSVTMTCVTTDPSLVPEDEILVYGPDLGALSGSAPYARIALIQVADIESDEEDDTEQAFRAIQNIDFVKYHVFPKGFMMRISAESLREQVRVSREAQSSGISFQNVGCTFLRKYHADPNVLAVKLIFVTDPDADFSALRTDARAARDITLTLTKIMEGLPTDCGSCSLKPICDEVEGMKELHFGKKSPDAPH